ncbi:MAG TPA: hypothetical protein VEB41_03100 [Burkholderiales bacterium]|nr:hypothetical protein [Burkholderiales bacterium]
MAARTIQQADIGNGRKVELVGRAEGEPEFYVDGIHGVQVTGPMVKMNLYTVGIDSTPAMQRRESVCRLVLSAPQFLQMVDFLSQFVAQARQAAQSAAAQNPAAKN